MARAAGVATFRVTMPPEVKWLVGEGMSRRKIPPELNRHSLATYAGRPCRVQHVNSLLTAKSDVTGTIRSHVNPPEVVNSAEA